MMKYLTQLFSLALFGLMLMLVSCSESEELVIAPPTSDDLSFSYIVDSENPNVLHFTGQTSVDTWYEHWNFDDGTGGEGLEATKVFFKAGEYAVRFKIFTDGGTAFVTQTVVIDQDFSGPDLIKNGGFDSEEFWTVFEIGPGAAAEISNGTASWQGGSWGNAGIFQEIDIEASKEYEISMNVSGSGMSDSWFEVYVGKVRPEANVDYSDGGILMALNTWDGCGNEEFSGQLSALICVGEGGAFSWPEAGLGYFVIKCGGADLGATGVTIDDVAIRSL